MFGEFNLPRVDAEIFTAYSLTDEYFSLLIEDAAVEMYQIVDAHLKNAKQERPCLTNDKLTTITAHKVYHLNLICRSYISPATIPSPV